MQMAELDIENEENEELVFEEGSEEEVNRFELCLVGRFLTEKNINVRAMKSKLADLWKPAMGISVKDLKPGLFLFQFYHKDDMNWVLNNGPWTFDNALLVVNVVKAGEDPVKVSLVEVDFWIQIHDLPVGYMTEVVGKQLGNFFGVFLQYDAKNNSSIWREFMRLRVRLDVRKPLKRKKKIVKKDKSEVVVHCKYEKLGDFCFLCGLLTHTERFCKRKLENEGEVMNKDWGHWLRAQPRRVGSSSKSKWLRDEGDGGWNRDSDKSNRFQENQENQSFRDPNISHDDMHMRDQRGNVTTRADFSEKTGDTANKSNLGGKSKTFESNGLDPEELYGLNMEERKRQRSEAHITTTKNTKNDTPNSGSTLSGSDCVETTPQFLATLAEQASQLP